MPKRGDKGGTKARTVASVSLEDAKDCTKSRVVIQWAEAMRNSKDRNPVFLRDEDNEERPHLFHRVYSFPTIQLEGHNWQPGSNLLGIVQIHDVEGHTGCFYVDKDDERQVVHAALTRIKDGEGKLFQQVGDDDLVCVLCRKPSQDLLLCSDLHCTFAAHLSCLNKTLTQKLTTIPEGDWFCQECVNR